MNRRDLLFKVTQVATNEFEVLRAKLNVLNLPKYLGVSIIALPRPLKKIYTTARKLVSNFKHIDIPVGSNLESICMQRAKFLGSFYADDDISVAVRVDN